MRIHTKAKNIADEVFVLLLGKLDGTEISVVVNGKDGDSNGRGPFDITNYMILLMGPTLHDVHKKVPKRIDGNMSSDQLSLDVHQHRQALSDACEA